MAELTETTWPERALLEVNVLPRRPRASHQTGVLRDAAEPSIIGLEDLSGIVVGLVLWLVIILVR